MILFLVTNASFSTTRRHWCCSKSVIIFDKMNVVLRSPERWGRSQPNVYNWESSQKKNLIQFKKKQWISIWAFPALHISLIWPSFSDKHLLPLLTFAFRVAAYLCCASEMSPLFTDGTRRGSCSRTESQTPSCKNEWMNLLKDIYFLNVWFLVSLFIDSAWSSLSWCFLIRENNEGMCMTVHTHRKNKQGWQMSQSLR